MIKLVLAAIALLSLGAGPGFAADLSPLPVAPTPVVVASAHDWSGFYAGVFAGRHAGTWALSQYDGRTDPGGLTGQNSRSNAGVTVGADLGYNVQYGAFVLGAEGDVAWNNAVVTPWGFSFDSCGCANTSTTWLGTLRARAGVAFDSVLLYATAGVAAGNIHYDYHDGPVGSEDHLGLGWAAGIGAELALNNNWSLKGEYLKVDLGSPTFFNGDFDFQSTVHSTADIFKVGLNYKF